MIAVLCLLSEAGRSSAGMGAIGGAAWQFSVWCRPAGFRAIRGEPVRALATVQPASHARLVR